MITLDEFKVSLGDFAAKLTDQEIEQLRLDMYQLAEVTYEVWDAERKRV